MRVRLAAAALTLATLASIAFSADGIRFELAARATSSPMRASTTLPSRERTAL